jgi:hypothetical protein
MARYLLEGEIFTPEKGRDEIITVFDGLMDEAKKHIQQEYDAQRIRGADYAKVYIASIEAVLGNTVQYLLGMSLVNENKDKIIADTILTEAQKENADAGTEQTKANTAQIEYQTTKVLPEDVRVKQEQGREIAYRVNNIMPKEGALLDRQASKINSEISLIDSKTTAERKQPALIDTQIALYNRQREAYDDDYNIKIYKAGTDVYSVVKTVTETAYVPPAYTRPEISWPSVLPRK